MSAGSSSAAIQPILGGDYQAAREALKPLCTPRAHQIRNVLDIIERLEQRDFGDATLLLYLLISDSDVPNEYRPSIVQAHQMIKSECYAAVHATLLEAVNIPLADHQLTLQHTLLMDGSTTVRQTVPIKHAGCVMWFVLFSFLGGVYSVFLGLTIPSSQLGGEAVRVYMMVVAPVLSLVMAFGVWHLKEWARKLVIVVQAIGLLYMGFRAPTVGFNPVFFAQVLPSSFVLYWFLTHEDLFS